MPGCDSAAVRRASIRKRSRNAWSPANSLLRSFTATCRPRTLSCARHTWPMPPLASRWTRQYRPARRDFGTTVEDIGRFYPSDTSLNTVIACCLRCSKSRRPSPPPPGLVGDSALHARDSADAAVFLGDRVVVVLASTFGEPHGGHLGTAEQVLGSHLHRLRLGAGGERDGVVPQHLRVDTDPRADQGTQRWQGAKLVAGEVATQFLLRRQARTVVTNRLADQVQIQATRGGDDHQRVAAPHPHRHRLEHLTGIDAKRSRLVGARVGLPVGNHLEVAALLLEMLGHDRHRPHPPGSGTSRRPSRRLLVVPRPSGLPYTAPAALPRVDHGWRGRSIRSTPGRDRLGWSAEGERRVSR